MPGIISGNQDSPAAIMAIIAAGIAGSAAATATNQELFATVIIAIALTTLLTGVFYTILGRFELGSLVRFLPYPVIGGFLAGTGWLLVVGAVGLMADLPVNLDGLAELVGAGTLWRWLPGLLFALVLMVGLERIGHAFALPGALIVAVLVFYIVAWFKGYSVGQLEDQGWLIGPFPGGNLLQPLPWGELNNVDWGAILGQLPNIGTLVLLSAVGLLLNASGLEIVAQKDIDINRELRAGGVANLVVGFTGGLVGFHMLSLSSLRIRLGPGGRLAGIVVALICLFVLVAGAGILSLFPKVIGGGLLLYLGLAFLKEWVYDTWFRLPLIEYSVIVFILIIIISVGFLEGIAVGIVAAIVLFVVAYSRVDVVRNELTGRHVSSRLSRSLQAQSYLYDHGDSLYILRLQGFIFFGTADRLLNQVRDRLNDPDLTAVEYITLDLHRVTGLDFTALTSLSKMRMLVVESGAMLVIVEASDVVRQQLQRGGLPADDYIRYLDTLDRGLEWIEERVLAAVEPSDVESPQTLTEQLSGQRLDADGLRRMFSLLERLEMGQGEYLMKQGDSPGDLYFIESGQATAQLEYPDRPPVRLQTMGGGHVLGELGFYLNQPRTASVIMDEPGVVYRLTRTRLEEMEMEAPDSASLIHRLIVHLLAERVTHLVNTVNALEQ